MQDPLLEVDYKFADQAEKGIGLTLDVIDSAYKGVRRAIDDANAKNKADEESKQKQDQEKASKELAFSSGTIISNLILDTEDPSEKDMEAFADLTEADLKLLIEKIDAVAKSFKQIPQEMLKALQTYDFLDASDKNRETLLQITSEIDSSLLPNIRKTMDRNHKYILDLWQETIEEFDSKTFQSSFIKTLKKLSQENQKINQSRVGIGSFLYVGTKLVEVFRAQLQVLEIRLQKLKTLVLKQTAQTKPLTQDHLQAVQKLVKNMK